MKVHVSLRAWRFESSFNPAMTRLLPDADGQEIGRDVLVDFDSKCLANSQASRTTQNKQYAFFRLFPIRQPAEFGCDGSAERVEGLCED